MAYGANLLYETNDKGERVLVKSLESIQTAYLRFTNRTSRPINVWWRDFGGVRRHYVTLEPGHFFDINTFLTHPWEFSDVATNERFVINNKFVFRAPTNVGDMRFRTNWNITVPVRTLYETTLLAIACLVPDEEGALDLDLPLHLTSDLQELITKLNNITPQRHD